MNAHDSNAAQAADDHPELALDALRTYLNGKMERYKLLFSVNGGAFAIAQIKNDVSLGHLDLEKLAIGAIAFTIVMTVDIWLWGQQMKETYLKNEEQAFTFAGKAILLLLSALLVLAWALAAEFRHKTTGLAILLLVLGAAVAHKTIKYRIANKETAKKESGDCAAKKTDNTFSWGSQSMFWLYGLVVVIAVLAGWLVVEPRPQASTDDHSLKELRD
jgi:Ca2+/Na+ antiporter